jgi:hypothetical protein
MIMPPARLLVAACLPMFLLANAPEPNTPIWQTLREGDTPEQVAEKLLGVKGIRSAKAKRNGVSIRHEGEGLEIYGARFKVAPEFQQGYLAKVYLGTEAQCVENARHIADDLLRALPVKYPEQLVPDDDVGRGAILDAMRVATEAEPKDVSHIRMNSETAVIFLQRVFHREAPPVAGVTSPTVAALLNLSWVQYDQFVRACPTHGSYRVQLALVYTSRAKLESLRSETEARFDQEDQDALDSL